MSMKDFMKRHRESKAAVTPLSAEPEVGLSSVQPTVAVNDKTGQVARKPAKVGKVLGATITYHCGHKVGISHLNGALCPGCQREKRKKNNDSYLERRGRRDSDQRLPDGSKFSAVYDAGKVMWRGELVIGEQVFTTEASGVMKLMPSLDMMYRAWLVKSKTGDKS